MKISKLCLASSLLCLSNIAWAQNLPAASEQNIRKKIMENHRDDGQKIVGLTGPLDRAAGGVSASSVQINTDQGETDITLSIAFDLDTYEPKETKPGFYKISSLQAVVQASAPLSGESSSTLLKKGSIVSGSKLKLSLSRFSTTLGDGRNTNRFFRSAYSACVTTSAQTWLKGFPNDTVKYSLAQKIVSDFQSRLSNNNMDSGDQSLINLTSADTTLLALVKTNCTPQVGNPLSILSDQDLVHRFTDDVAKFDAAFFDRTPLSFLGLDASVGEQSFETLDRTAFETSSISRTSWEIGAYYGWIGPNVDWSARARVVYGVGYSAPDEAQVCRPQAMGVDLECISGPDGLPIKNETGLVQIEYRHLFKLIDDQRIGIAPQVTYDIDEDEFDVDVPIYLAPDEKGKLNGGLRLGYSTRDDDFTVGLFVGVPFSIFFN